MASPGAGAGAAPASIRRHNLALVLRLLVDGGPRSRAGIAQATRLTKATASKLTSVLLDRGLVRETRSVQGSTGRPATLVDVSPDRVVGLGLVLDVDSSSVGAVDLTGAAHHLVQERADNRAGPPEAVLARAASLVRDLQRTVRAEARVPAALTIAVPGLVADGVVRVAPNLGWTDLSLLASFERALRVRPGRAGVGSGPPATILLDNEANLAAFAETRVRAARTFIHVSAGVGVGAGVVIDGAVYRGVHGFGGEFGHFVVDPAGQRCACGNRGCVETIAGKEQLLAACGLRERRGAAAPLDRAWVEPIVRAASNGDERVVSALHHVADALATALASAVSLFDPACVVLGGYLTDLAPWLAPRIEASLAERTLGSRWITYGVHASTHGERAPLLGAGWSSLNHVIADPLRVAPLP